MRRCAVCAWILGTMTIAACPAGGGDEGDTGDTSMVATPGSASLTMTSPTSGMTGDLSTSAATSEGTTVGGAEGSSSSSGGAAKFDLGAPVDASGPCQEIEVTPQPRRPNVALVLDYSSSMQLFLGDKTRWSILWEAVDFLIDGWDAQLNLGMMLFPDLDAVDYNSCVTEDFEVPVAPMNGAAILAVLPGPDFAPPGNTPTRSGVLVAAAHLETLDPAIPRAIVLVTDGDALCGSPNDMEQPDEGVDEVIGEVHSVRGIPTYVIGLAAEGTSYSDHLDEMGLAGGRANPAADHDYYPGEDQASLQAAFEQVAIDVITCTLDLEMAPDDPDLFKVSVDDVEYEYVADCDQGDGWTFVPDTMDLQITLCGAACAAFKGGAKFTAKQYCLNG